MVEVSRDSSHVYSRTYLPRLGIATLGAILKKAGLGCDLFFQGMSPLDEQKLQGYDIVGISSLTNAIGEAYRLGDRLKGSAFKVVMGGPHVSFMLEEALAHCDYVVLGEGDLSFPALVGALAGGGCADEVPGVAFWRNGGVRRNGGCGEVDYPNLPSPDFLLSEQVRAGKLPPIIVTSRGCPYNCVFCSVSAMFGRKYRFKRSEQVIAELRPVLGRSVCFGDDNFCANPGRTKELLGAMIDQDAVPLRWSGEMCVEAGSDEEMLDLMWKTRCRIVFVGIESIDQATLKKFGKAHKVAAIAQCIDNLHRRGIGIHGMFVVSPEDTPGTVREMVDYAISQDIDTIQIMSLTPLPGTASFTDLADRMLHRDWKYFDGMHVVVEPAHCSAYDLQKAIILEMGRFYSLKHMAGAYRRGRAWRVRYRAGGHYIVRSWTRENADYLERLRTNFPKTS